jgi:hypothetical protein
VTYTRPLTVTGQRFFFYTYLRSADFLPRLFALTMQLRPTLYLPVAATTSNRVRQMDRKIRYRSAEKEDNQHRHK